MSLITQWQTQIRQVVATQLDEVLRTHPGCDLGLYLARHLRHTFFGQLDDIYASLSYDRDDAWCTDTNLTTRYPRLAHDIRAGVAGVHLLHLCTTHQITYHLPGDTPITAVLATYEHAAPAVPTVMKEAKQ